MSVPTRIAAIAEVMWSPQDKRVWGDFRKRMDTQVKRFEAINFNYRKLDAPEFKDLSLQK